MTTILKQVAFMRDNTYHLHRYVWNDVQEEWPYYTEQEKAMLKRRKPQNLTPPGSSDGSSGTVQFRKSFNSWFSGYSLLQGNFTFILKHPLILNVTVVNCVIVGGTMVALKVQNALKREYNPVSLTDVP